MSTDVNSMSPVDKRVATAYRQAMADASPGPQLDNQVIQLAKASVESSEPTPLPDRRVLGVPRNLMLAAAALLLVTVAGVLAITQQTGSDWQPAGGETAKPPATLPPVPAIRAPELTPPSEQSKPADCDTGAQSSCPDDAGQDTANPLP